MVMCYVNAQILISTLQCVSATWIKWPLYFINIELLPVFTESLAMCLPLIYCYEIKTADVYGYT